MTSLSNRTSPRKPVMTLITGAAVALAAIALAACGGGDDGGSSAGATPAATLSLTGTAAIGALIANRPIEAKCATGTATGTTKADGSYALSVSNASWPCLLRVTAADGSTLYTVAAGSGNSAIANITPATQLILANLVAGDPAAYYQAFAAATASVVTAAAVADAQARVIAGLKAAGIDLSAAGDLIAGALAAADAYDKALDALAAALVRSGSTLQSLTTSFAAMSSSAVASLPPGLLLQPAAATCSALRSATYRLVTPRAGATMADQTSRIVIDAATLAVTRGDGSTGSLVANGPCRFTDQGGSYAADIVVSQAGVLVARYTKDGGASFQNFVGFPEQAHALADIAGAWNVIGMTRLSTGYVATAGSATLDAAGKVTAASVCQNNTTWAIDVCSDPGASVIALAPPLTVDSDGGFSVLDATTQVAASRAFAYQAGSGDLMLVTVGSNGGFVFYAPIRSVALPTVGAQTTNWNFDILAQLGSAQALYLTSNTVAAIDAAAGSWSRIQMHPGQSDDHSETLFANSPRTGFVRRPAATSTTINGAVVNVNEFTALRMPGMGISPLVLPNLKLFEVSAVTP